MGSGSINPVIKNKVSELILKGRKDFLQAAGWSAPSPDDITVDTPIPYDLRDVWYELDYLNRAIVMGNKNSGNFAETDKGDPKTLNPAPIQPYAAGGPFQNMVYGQYGPLPDRMLVRLKDPRFAFLSRSFPDPAVADPYRRFLTGGLEAIGRYQCLTSAVSLRKRLMLQLERF